MTVILCAMHPLIKPRVEMLEIKWPEGAENTFYKGWYSFLEQIAFPKTQVPPSITPENIFSKLETLVDDGFLVSNGLKFPRTRFALVKQIPEVSFFMTLPYFEELPIDVVRICLQFRDFNIKQIRLYADADTRDLSMILHRTCFHEVLFC